jgi:PAS domain S-box-containing protein
MRCQVMSMRVTSTVRGANSESAFTSSTDSLRGTEEQFREIFENAADAMYTTDLAGTVTSINRAGERLTGYTRGELLGSNIARVLAPEHLALALEMTDPETGREHTEPYELDIVTKDGRRIPLEVRTRLIHRNGHPAGIHGIARDITSRRRADDEARRRAVHLEALNEIISTADAAPDLPRLLEAAIDRALDVLGVGVGGIWAGDHHVVRGLPSEVGPAISGTVKNTGATSLASEAVEDWRASLRGAEGAAREMWTRLGLRASLTVPIQVEGRSVGALAVAARDARAWLPEEVAFVEAVSQQIGATAEGLRLFRDVQLRAELMGRLVALSESLNRPAPVAGVAAAIGQAALSLSGVRKAAVCLHNPDATTTCAWSEGVAAESVMRMVIPDIPGPWARVTGTAEPGRMILAGSHRSEAAGPILFSDVQRLPSAARAAAGDEGVQAIGVWPLTYEGRVIASVSCYYDAADARPVWSQPERDAIQSFSWQAAAALENARLYEAENQKAKELEQAYIEMVLALSRAMDARDAYTADHSERLAGWADAVARSLGCSDQEIQDVRWGALLHDIGKIGVPDRILRKPGQLTVEEWVAMRLHPVIGERILMPAGRLRGVAKIVRHHQERWDGTGYPEHLAGKAIPLGARILAIVDAYGAIIDDRPYKAAHTHEEAIAELRRCAGTQFDPEIVEAFCRVLERETSHTDQVLLFR